MAGSSAGWLRGVSFGNVTACCRRLARGGMAEVFLARQQGMEGFERRVKLSSSACLPHLLRLQAEFYANVHVPRRGATHWQLSGTRNIIRIYDSSKVDDYYFIADGVRRGASTLGRLIKQARTCAGAGSGSIAAHPRRASAQGLHYAPAPHLRRYGQRTAPPRRASRRPHARRTCSSRTTAWSRSWTSASPRPRGKRASHPPRRREGQVLRYMLLAGRAGRRALARRALGACSPSASVMYRGYLGRAFALFRRDNDRRGR